MRIQVVHPREVTGSHAEAWADLRQRSASLANPYFSLGFQKAVGSVRDDARVAVIEDGGKPVGFLGVQGRSRFSALPIGAPLSDYQGLIADPNLMPPIGALCRALGVGRLDFSFVPADQAAFLGGACGEGVSRLCRLDADPNTLLESMRERRKETLRQQDRKWRKLLREEQDVVFTADSTDRRHLETLLAWKTDQCLRTGQPLVWGAPWVREVVNATFASRDNDFRGRLFTLTKGDELIAATYLLQSGTVLHDWLLGFNGAFEHHSPGILVTRRMLEWAGSNGIVEVDFGAGDYRYKREFANSERRYLWGFLAPPNLSGALRGLAYRGRSLIEALPPGPLAEAPGKLMRRIDVVRGLATKSHLADAA